uniref:S41 family peptidase n=1 Tax=Nonomuraea pusilla TaxID=46177 RepID=UPI0006E43D77|nr:S41 family peptidase [Nonomuraea pusilla]
MRIKTTAAVALATAALLAPAAPAHASTAGRLDGFWRSDGYGMVASIKDGVLRLYDVTAISCLPHGEPVEQIGRGPGGAATFGQEGQPYATLTPRTRDRARAAFTGDVATKDLHRVPALPPRCAQPARRDPVTTFDVFWRNFQENYLDFAAKGVDWKAQRDRYRPKVNSRTTDEQLFTVLSDMIRPLGDAHTGIMAGEKRQFMGIRPGTRLPLEGALKKKIDKSVAANLGVPMREWGAGQLGYADLPDGLGYLRITGFGGYAGETATLAADQAALDRVLDTVFTPDRVRRLRGLVIDVRFNSGGYDLLGLQVAARLTEKPYLAYTKRARDDAGGPSGYTPTRPVKVRPASGTVYDGPIALLTSDMTVSAGETFTMALAGRTPEPTRIGSHTQGAFSDILARVLPNGWQFGLSNEDYRTPSGKTYEGVGLPPHIRTPVFTDDELAAGRDSALERAVALLTPPNPSATQSSGRGQ